MAEMKVFSGTNSRYVALKIAKQLGVELGKINISHFADGEFEVCYEEPVRGAEIYLVQSTFKASENLMELLLMIDAAKRASAQSVIAVIPYFGWARQDRKDKPRVSIAAKLVTNLLIAAGIDRLITMDLHADQIQGFFDIPEHGYRFARRGRCQACQLLCQILQCPARAVPQTPSASQCGREHDHHR